MAGYKKIQSQAYVSNIIDDLAAFLSISKPKCPPHVCQVSAIGHSILNSVLSLNKRVRNFKKRRKRGQKII